MSDDEAPAPAPQRGVSRNELVRNEQGPLEGGDRDYGTRPGRRDTREPIPQSLVQYQPRVGRAHPHREYMPFLGKAVAVRVQSNRSCCLHKYVLCSFIHSARHLLFGQILHRLLPCFTSRRVTANEQLLAQLRPPLVRLVLGGISFLPRWRAPANCSTCT